ncbi:nuclear transport factor 2 family protein [Algibacter amylolyticus]|uniref:Nuclear transport factor 2 family protein n=1 Tax=Algibacter amylolyticus TaxID=1608400 RepID=A0A5M7BGR4_9FLAO|nr:nuclear transport factor 2 family protein [Algibacter amylolyticus]KAA5827970.1 nuclear transport factor 2 family protein [Algibacter amylolyticus]MBB5267208.1 ketosteroid isomerase-like protein [Algibacter amylolyticus]TSJ82215.1 nuclear transport factor 2 family protein [Algibacter amylolyticus]
MKKLIVLLCILCFCNSYSQTNDEDDVKAINKVLKKQRIAWSNHDFEGYMAGYWDSELLKFYSKNGVTYGWENTFDRYEKAYPTKEHTGKLSFKINDITKISEGAYYVLGEYHIKRDMGNADGIFMLVFKKINGEWKIIADTST